MSLAIDPQIHSALAQARTAAQNKPLEGLQVDPKDAQEVSKLAEQFESLFIDMMLRTMRESVNKSGFMDGGHAEDIYRGMLDSEYAKIMAEQRQTGLAGSIEKHLLQAIGASQESAKTVKSLEGERAYKAAALQPALKRENIETGTTVTRSR